MKTKLSLEKQEEMINQYETKLMEMKDEELKQEYCDCLTNECGELEELWTEQGRDIVIDRLTDKYGFELWEENQ